MLSSIQKLSRLFGNGAFAAHAAIIGCAAISFPASAEVLPPVNQVLISGQSLAYGWGGSEIISDEPSGNHLMFNDGMHGSDYWSFSPLRESFLETIASGMANTVTNHLEEDGQDSSHTMLMSLAARGGTQIAKLDKQGGDPYKIYQRGSGLFWAGWAVSTAIQGRDWHPAALAWLQGESDLDINTPPDVYKARLKQLREDYQSDILASTGVAATLPMLTYQTNAWGVASISDPGGISKAQLALSEEDPNVYMVTPIYFLTYVDGVHPDSDSYRKLGGYFGKVYKKVVIDGEAWSPLKPLAASQQGKNQVVVSFHVPVPPLVLDTTLVSNPGDYGFEVYDKTGRLDIHSVSLAGDSQVVITTVSQIRGNATVKYAYSDAPVFNVAGPLQGARGNLRDSDPSLGFGLSANGEDYNLYNWCVVFEMAAVGGEPTKGGRPGR